MTKKQFPFFTLLLLFVMSCSNTKYLPEGELLYVGGDVKIEDKEASRKERKVLRSQLEGMLRPKPNSNIFGLRPKLYIYNIAGEPKKAKGLRYWLRTKVGEPPVLFSQVDLDYNADVLRNYSDNKGYFKARVSADSTSRRKRAKAHYTVTTGKQYRIKSVTFPQDTTQIDTAVAITKDQTLLQVGRPFDLDIIKAERARIDGRLKEKGYYYFNDEFLIVQVDSTAGTHEVDLFVKVKPETPNNARTVYKINDIFVYPSFVINRDTMNLRLEDIENYKDLTIIDKRKKFKPKVFDRAMFFSKGDLYNRTDHNLSLNRLVNLGTFKFVKNSFRVTDSVNNMLDTYYYLTPLPRKSIRVEVLGKTNSANYAGTELNVNWSNRNTFRAAELLTISAFGGLEVQVSGQNKGFNVYRIGSEASLVWPRFISPFKHQFSSAFVPRTKATVGYEFQFREQLYTLSSAKGSFGYLWKENIRKEHQLNILEVNYVRPTDVSALYREEIRQNPSLEKVIERQLIFGPTYSYTYTNTTETAKKHTFFYKGTLDLAGTAAGLLSGANIRKGDSIKLFGVPFSQYVKMENDFRHYLKLGTDSQLASRIIVGTGYGYGNSTELPFIKQFFIGGTNSIRAFRARSIGPGSFNEQSNANAFLPDQSGDFKLELNTEYRAKLFSVVHGAVFVDAGNIWLANRDELKPGGEISKDFYKELAVGTGVGLRFDLSFLVLRTDLAFPIRKPYLPEGNRWVLDQVNFGSSGWRKENLVFNLAIGYPF